MHKQSFQSDTLTFNVRLFCSRSKTYRQPSFALKWNKVKCQMSQDVQVHLTSNQQHCDPTLTERNRLYSPAKDLITICWHGQWEHTEPPLIWTAKQNTEAGLHTVTEPQLLFPLHNIPLSQLWGRLASLSFNDSNNEQFNEQNNTNFVELHVNEACSNRSIHPGDDEGRGWPFWWEW